MLEFFIYETLDMLRSFLLVFFIGSHLAAPLVAADMSAGHSIAVQGKVKAQSPTETKERTLKRGSMFFSTDVVTVAADGKAQLKFIDGGLVTLLPSTVYRITSYVFTEEKSEVSIDLLEGGFRAMTGTIGKTHPTNYTVKTPVATIAVRGTIFDVILQNCKLGGDSLPTCELSVGALDGTVLVTNSGGTVSLTPGNYVVAATASNMGSSTSTPPPSIAAANFSPPPGGDSMTTAQAAINQQPVIPPPAPAPSSTEEITEIPSSTEAPSSTAETPPTVEPEAQWLYVPEVVGNPSCG